MEIYMFDEPFIVSLPFVTAAEHFYSQGVTLLGAKIVSEAKVSTILYPTVLP